MAESRQTDVDADSATTAAARIVVFAEEVDRVWRDVGPQILAKNAARPWGDDSIGRDFEEHYLPAAQGAVEAADAIVSRLIDTGTGIGIAALSTQTADEDSARGMGGSP